VELRKITNGGIKKCIEKKELLGMGDECNGLTMIE